MSLAINGTDGIDFNLDDAKIKLGAGDDLIIEADGNNSKIVHNGDGNFIIEAAGADEDITIQATDDVFIKVQGSENAVRCLGDGAVELYHNNAKKLETVTGGVTVTGTCTATSFAGSGAALTGIASPAMVKLNTFETTAGDNVQACNVDGHFTSDYHAYLYILHVSPDDANSDFSWRVMRGGSVVTANEYAGHAFRGYNDTSDNNQVGASGEPSAGDYDAPDDGVFPHADDMVDGNIEHTSTLELFLYNPLSTSEWKRFKSTFMFQATYNMNTHYQNGMVQNTAALSGVSFYMNNSSADIVCKGALYGLTI